MFKLTHLSYNGSCRLSLLNFSINTPGRVREFTGCFAPTNSSLNNNFSLLLPINVYFVIIHILRVLFIFVKTYFKLPKRCLVTFWNVCWTKAPVCLSRLIHKEQWILWCQKVRNRINKSVTTKIVRIIRLIIKIIFPNKSGFLFTLIILKTNPRIAIIWLAKR